MLNIFTAYYGVISSIILSAVYYLMYKDKKVLKFTFFTVLQFIILFCMALLLIDYKTILIR